MFNDLIKPKDKKEDEKYSVSLCSFDESGKLIVRKDFRSKLVPQMKQDLRYVLNLDLEDELVDVLKDEIKADIFRSGIVRDFVKEVFGF